MTPRPIVSPLTYSDAMGLAIDVAPHVDVVTLSLLVRTLLDVDKASREQSGAQVLLSVLKKVQYELDNDCPLTAQQIAEKAILAADPESEPIEAVCERIRAAGEAYINSPTHHYVMQEKE